MKHIKAASFLIASFLTISCFLSCRKYLEKKPSNLIQTPSSIADLQALLDNSGVMNNTTPSYGEASGDDYFILTPTLITTSTNLQNSYKWIPYPYTHGNDWSNGYLPIYYANLCLENIETLPRTNANAAAWDNVKGSGLYYRAFHFLNLAWTFAKAYDASTANTDLGISIRTSSDLNVASTRASVSETYERIIRDAKESIPLLPDLPFHVVRPSKVSSYALLARTYLSMRIYDSSLKYSNLSLQIKSNLTDYNMTPCSTCDIRVTLSPTSTANPFLKFNSETIFYTQLALVVSSFATSRALIDTFLYASYGANDRRRDAFFAPSGSYKKFKGSYAQSTTSFFSGITTAEMYLTRAESWARTGNKDAALTDLNALLIKRWKTGTFVPVTATDAADAVNKILVERRKELIFRGLRWIDIKRLNLEGRNIILTRLISGQTYTLQPNANYYALPLPTDIIELTGMQQNPYP